MDNTNISKSHKSLEDALIALRHTLTEAMVEEAKKQGSSLTHFEILKFIAEYGNPTMKDIAKQLHITPPSASTLIDTLVEKKLVHRVQTPEDRRTVKVVLAPHAQVLLSSIHKKKYSVFNKMLSKLNSEDKKELARILIKCIN